MTGNKVKKIIYSILQEVLEGEGIPTAQDYDITDTEFIGIIKLMKDEGYLNPKNVSFYIGGGIDIKKSIDSVTMKGIEFLEENNKWAKFYKGIKEFSNFIRIK